MILSPIAVCQNSQHKPKGSGFASGAMLRAAAFGCRCQSILKKLVALHFDQFELERMNPCESWENCLPTAHNVVQPQLLLRCRSWHQGKVSDGWLLHRVRHHIHDADLNAVHGDCLSLQKWRWNSGALFVPLPGCLPRWVDKFVGKSKARKLGRSPSLRNMKTAQLG